MKLLAIIISLLASCPQDNVPTISYYRLEDFKTPHYESKSIQADSIRIFFDIKIGTNVNSVLENMPPFNFSHTHVYRNGNMRILSAKEAISKNIIDKDILDKTALMALGYFTKYLENKTGLEEITFQFPFMINKAHKVKKTQEPTDHKNNEKVSFRINLSKKVKIYVSDNYEYKLKLFKNGNFEYENALFEMKGNGTWTQRNDTLTLQSIYFENSVDKYYDDPSSFIFKYTDEQYVDRFVINGDKLLPIIPSNRNDGAFYPFNTIRDFLKFLSDRRYHNY